MTRYGLSEPTALAEATRISRRAGMGFGMATLACILIRKTGHEAAAGQAFAIVFSYLFFGIALATAGRRRMLVATARTGTTSRVMTIAMLGIGVFLVLVSAMTLTTLASMVLDTIGE